MQGTATVVLAGVLAGLRGLGARIADQRVVIAGAGAAGIGIAQLLARSMTDDGPEPGLALERIVLVDSHGLAHEGRADLDPSKQAMELPAAATQRLGIAGTPPASLAEVVAAVRPTILLGTTGTAGSFDEAVLRALGEDGRPIVMPLSNPTSACEATPEDVLHWTNGRAIVATGSPFPAVVRDGRVHEISQANNVYVFPGLGLGCIVAEVREVSDAMIMAAARTLATMASAERLAAGSIYPPVDEMRAAARAIAVAVVREAVAGGQARIHADADAEAEVDAAIWWPEYVPYTPLSAAG